MKKQPIFFAPQAKSLAPQVTALILIGTSVLGISSCTPRVEVAAPEKPITINLNVKIDHEVKVKVEKDLDKVISENSELF